MIHSQSGPGPHTRHRELLVEAHGILEDQCRRDRRLRELADEAVAAASFTGEPGDVLELRQLGENLEFYGLMGGEVRRSMRRTLTKMRRLLARVPDGNTARREPERISG